jgi:ferric enterobactin receptor
MSRFFFLLTVLSLLSLGGLKAQNAAPGGPGKVSGRIIDSVTSLSIEYATISIQIAGQQKVITGTTSDTSGKFNLKGIPEGAYQVSVEFIGYKAFKTSIEISKSKAEVQLGSIFLHSLAASLEAVTVTGTKKLIDNRIDKMVFNAEADLTGQSGAATDLLKKIPQVSVDPEGNVELAGAGGIRFLINGKPSSAFGSNVADVLQSIPASQIKSIEVITNPGAKYDAQGMGGIINIILKQSRVRGINGSLAITTGTRVENGSLNLNMRQGNFGMNAFISGNSRLPVTTPFTTLRSSYDSATNQGTLLSQDGNNRISRNGIESGLGFDWIFNKYNNISGNLGYNTFRNASRGMIYQLQSGGLPDLTKTLNRLNSNSDFHSIDASIEYQKKFRKEDQELSVSANTSIGKREANANNLQSFILKDSAYYGIQNVNFGNESESQISVDYVQPFAEKVLFGAGGRISFDDITSDANVMSLQPASKTYRYDSAVSNNLDYHQRVYALYSELSFPFSNWFDAKVGAR